jgi:hypothetical protein
MGFAGAGEEFRVVLAGEEEGMAFEFNQFHQAAVGGDAADLIAGFKEEVAVGVIEFIAMAVAFVDHLFPIERLALGAGH